MSIFSGFKKNRGLPRCSAVIAAAGSSTRMDGEDKLFAELCGVPVLAHTLRAFQESPPVDEIIVVVRGEMLERAAELCRTYGIDKAGTVIAGGESRISSVYNGVLAASDKAGLIAIHDGARPCVDLRVIEDAIKAAAKLHAATPAVPLSSTVKRVSNGVVTETVSRGDLYEIQTPQVFDADLIKAALTKALKIGSEPGAAMEFTDDCMAVESIGFPVHITEGSRNNIKLTTREDMAIAEAFLGKPMPSL